MELFSDSFMDAINRVIKKYDDPIANHIKYIHDVNDEIKYLETIGVGSTIVEIAKDKLATLVTDKVSAISLRVGDETFEVSFLPKGKDIVYSSPGKWSKENRQTGKPVRIIQQLVATPFKQIEWEVFGNRLKAIAFTVDDFELVKGEDIRNWYDEVNYYKCAATLGNSCMRYDYCSSYFDVYVDNAEMLISTRDGQLTGRAIVWRIGDITIMDRIYTCFDHLVDYFISYAKEHKWWIRTDNSLLSTGDNQYWFSPDDNYANVQYRRFSIIIKNEPEKFPYMDSFRYYNPDTLTLTNYVIEDGDYAELDRTEGDWEVCSRTVWTCEHCGRTFTTYSDEDAPDDLHYSEYDDCWYCDNCCWYSSWDGLWYPNSMEETNVYFTKDFSHSVPNCKIEDMLIDNSDVSEFNDNSHIVKIDGDYYFTCATCLTYNPETRNYSLNND